MVGTYIVFSISIVICFAIGYVLAILWFGDVRNRQIKSMFVLGTVVCLWTLFDAVSLVSSGASYSFVYTLRMVIVCVLPYCLLWFFLNFTSSRLVNSKVFFRLMVILPALDIFALVTNPLHHLYFKDYVQPQPTPDILFWVHTALVYLILVGVLIRLLHYIVRTVRTNRTVLVTAIFLLLPLLLSVAFTFGVLPYDLTPIGLFAMFLMFAFTAYKSGLLNIRMTAAADMFNNMRDVMLIVDGRGLITDNNQAIERDFPDFEIRHGVTTLQDLVDYLRGRAINKWPANLFDVLPAFSEDYSGGEFSIPSEDGIPKTFTISRRALHGNGTTAGRVVVMSDVSMYRAMINEINDQNERLVELKDMAESASRSKSAFLANMSHEIRTPMNAIIGMDDLLSRTDLTPSQQSYTENIRSAATALLSIINDILDFSKIESGNFELTPTPYRFESVLQGVVSVISARMGESGVPLLVEVDPGVPDVLIGDEGRVRQVLLNLLSNAVKFTREGYVRLAVSSERATEDSFRLTLEVEDTGVGIDEKNYTKLFRAFQQVDTRKNREEEGTGLGLAIARSFVELMGGSITVDSTAGKGTTFTATIVQGVSADAGSSAVMEAPERLRALVCDLNEYSRESLAKTLRAYRVETLTCAGVHEAEKLLTEEAFTHVFATTAFEPMYKAVTEAGAMSVVLLSPWEMFDEVDKALSYVYKPVLPGTLCRVLGGERYQAGYTQMNYERPFTAPEARVLVVDDNEINLQVALGLLSEYDLILESVMDGFGAVDLIRENHYDLVFMDHMMPGIDGLDATRLIRGDDRDYMQNLPIIALTANAIAGMRETFIRNGMNDYISKPIDSKELRRVLKRWLPGSKIIEAEPGECELEGVEEDLSGQLLDPDMLERVFRGSRAMYAKIIGKFVDNGESNIEFINTTFESRDIERFTIEVHGVKGAAASLGAMLLSERARELEELGKAGDIEGIGKRLVSFAKVYRSTLEVMKRTLDQG